MLIRLHKKADLLEMKVNGTKHRKVCADESSDLGKNGGIVQSFGHIV